MKTAWGVEGLSEALLNWATLTQCGRGLNREGGKQSRVRGGHISILPLHAPT